MSQLRQNLLTGNWTVIAPERGNKPERLKKATREDIRSLGTYDEACPFCPGNEKKFPQKLVSEIVDDRKWLTRIIENKYKIFDDHQSCPITPEKFETYGIYNNYQGCGNHWLVLEHPTHNKVMGEFSDLHIQNVFKLYKDASLKLQANPNNLIAVQFKNQGPNAGGSQPHAHSQIVGSRVVPSWIRTALHEQEKYFDTRGICPLCHILEFENGENERVIAETQDTFVLSPYAASFPYEVWIVPKRHFSCIIDANNTELNSIAIQVRDVLGKYLERLDNPDFNYFIHSSPYALSRAPYYHFYVQIIPRINMMGGFEVGTKIRINQVEPREVVQLLK